MRVPLRRVGTLWDAGPSGCVYVHGWWGRCGVQAPVGGRAEVYLYRGCIRCSPLVRGVVQRVGALWPSVFWSRIPSLS